MEKSEICNEIAGCIVAIPVENQKQFVDCLKKLDISGCPENPCFGVFEEKEEKLNYVEVPHFVYNKLELLEVELPEFFKEVAMCDKDDAKNFKRGTICAANFEGGVSLFYFVHLCDGGRSAVGIGQNADGVYSSRFQNYKISDVVRATPEQVKQFNSNLKKRGITINSFKDGVEVVEDTPRSVGEKVFIIIPSDGRLIVKAVVDDGSDLMELHYKAGNYFLSREEAILEAQSYSE